MPIRAGFELRGAGQNVGFVPGGWLIQIRCFINLRFESRFAKQPDASECCRNRVTEVLGEYLGRFPSNDGGDGYGSANATVSQNWMPDTLPRQLTANAVETGSRG